MIYRFDSVPVSHFVVRWARLFCGMCLMVRGLSFWLCSHRPFFVRWARLFCGMFLMVRGLSFWLCSHRPFFVRWARLFCGMFLMVSGLSFWLCSHRPFFRPMGTVNLRFCIDSCFVVFGKIRVTRVRRMEIFKIFKKNRGGDNVR